MLKHKLVAAISISMSLGLWLGFVNRNLISDYLRGAALSIMEDTTGSSNGLRKLVLFNPTLYRVRVVGYNASCSCVVTNEVPINVDGLSAVSVSFDRMITPEATIQFFVDRPSADLGWKFR